MTLDSGLALSKFLAICEGQCCFREPPGAAHTAEVAAQASGIVAGIDNRRLAKVAKLAGAPLAAAAGLDCGLRVGDRVERGQALFTVHAQTRGELDYALAYARANPGILALREPTP